MVSRKGIGNVNTDDVLSWWVLAGWDMISSTLLFLPPDPPIEPIPGREGSHDQGQADL